MLNRFIKDYQLGEFANPDQRDAYFFFPHAIEKGILNTDELEPNLPCEAAQRVRNAQIPAQAGTVELSNEEIAAYDLVAGRYEGNRLIIGPTFKDGVEKDSRKIVREGLLTLSFADSGLVKVVAEIADSQSAEWATKYRVIGKHAVRFLGLEAPTLEITNMDSDSAVATPLKPVFSFPSLLK